MKPIKTIKLTMAGLLACAMAGNLQGGLVGHFEFEGDLTDSLGAYTATVTSNGTATGLNIDLTANPGELTLTNPDSSTDIDILSIDYTPGDSGSFAFWYGAGGIYDYNSIFNNSATANDWEMWTYGSGLTRGRIGADTPVDVRTSMTEDIIRHHYTFTWERDPGDATRVTVNLYRDGELEDSITGNWVAPGNLLIGGGPGTGNDGGSGTYDDFRIYDHALSAAEVAALIPDLPVLIGHFEFDGDLTDSLGNYAATVVGGAGNVSTTANPGKLTITNPDSADGIDWLDIDYTPGDSGSFAFWYEAGAIYADNSIFSNSADADDWEMFTNGGGLTRGRVEDDSFVDVTSGTTTAGLSHHYVFTWERDPGAPTQVTVNLYRDGTLEETRTGTWADPGNLLIGGGPGTGNDGGNGIYDDFRIYDRALSADRVAILAIPPPPSAVLVGHFKFDGDLTDSQGNYTAMVVGDAGNVSTTANPRELTITNPDSAEGIDWVDIDYTPGDSGSFAFWYEAGAIYNYNSVFANSAQQDDWEMWTYGDGRTRVRIEGDSVATVAGTEAGVDHHYVFTWARNEGQVAIKLYQDGALIQEDTGTWVDPGNLLLGGSFGNEGGNGIYDDFRIYDGVLTPEQAAALLTGTQRPLRITSSSYDSNSDAFTLTWDSEPDTTYFLEGWKDVATGWDELDDSIGSAGLSTTFTYFGTGDYRIFRVRK